MIKIRKFSTAAVGLLFMTSPVFALGEYALLDGADLTKPCMLGKAADNSEKSSDCVPQNAVYAGGLGKSGVGVETSLRIGAAKQGPTAHEEVPAPGRSESNRPLARKIGGTVAAAFMGLFGFAGGGAIGAILGGGPGAMVGSWTGAIIAAGAGYLAGADIAEKFVD